MNFNTILAAVQAIGAATPAFKLIFDQVVVLFSQDEQAQLQKTYAQALDEADRAHRAAQAL